MTLMVYCDTGAYQRGLAELESRGAIAVHQFKYENRNRRIRNSAPPSNPSLKHMNYTWAELRSDPVLSQLTYESAGQTSTKFEELLTLLGNQCLVDAKHLDSAVLSNCSVFLATDKDDVWSRRAEIRAITGLEVLYMPDEWPMLMDLIARHERGEG